MIKEKQAITQFAFINELEKNAQWASIAKLLMKVAPQAMARTAKMLRGAAFAKAQGGWKAGWKHLAKFQTPIHFVSKGGPQSTAGIKSLYRGAIGLDRDIMGNIGNMAANITSLGQGVAGRGL